MKLLMNGCSRSEISVTPQNWNTQKASVKKPWKIHYRFYDPSFKDHPKYKGKKQVAIRRMNDFHTLEERQAITRELIELEKETVDVRGFNPISTKFMAPDQPVVEGEITTGMPFISALRLALEKIDAVQTTKDDIESTLKYFEQSAIMLQKHNLPVGDVRRKDIRLILDNCKNVVIVKDGKPVKKNWSNNQFNHYRSYLSMLYSELEQQEVIEYNPIKKIAKKEVVVNIREVLTDDERLLVDNHLRQKVPSFHRYVHIFFHSGTRRTELLRVQGRDVDLPGQRFKILVKKGKRQRWVWKTIKDIALPFWVDAMKDCGQEDYVFSIDLKPGQSPIRPEQVTRRWRRHVKDDLGIKADFYSLKHLHTTEIRDMVNDEDQGAKAAAEHNSHTSTAMVVNIYDVKSEARKHSKVKAVRNKFA